MPRAGRLDNIEVLCVGLDAMAALDTGTLGLPLLLPDDRDAGRAGLRAGP